MTIISDFMKAICGKGRTTPVKHRKQASCTNTSGIESDSDYICPQKTPKDVAQQGRGKAPFDVINASKPSNLDYTPTTKKNKYGKSSKRIKRKGLFLSEFSLGTKIGDGTHSSVYLCMHNATGELFTCKVKIVVVMLMFCSLSLHTVLLLAFFNDDMLSPVLFTCC